ENASEPVARGTDKTLARADGESSEHLIPYSDLMVNPDNWPDVTRKRAAQQKGVNGVVAYGNASGQSPPGLGPQFDTDYSIGAGVSTNSVQMALNAPGNKTSGGAAT